MRESRSFLRLSPRPEVRCPVRHVCPVCPVASAQAPESSRRGADPQRFWRPQACNFFYTSPVSPALCGHNFGERPRKSPFKDDEPQRTGEHRRGKRRRKLAQWRGEPGDFWRLQACNFFYTSPVSPELCGHNFGERPRNGQCGKNTIVQENTHKSGGKVKRKKGPSPHSPIRMMSHKEQKNTGGGIEE